MKHIFIYLSIIFFTACNFPGIFDGDNNSGIPDSGTISEQQLLFVNITGGIAGVNDKLTVIENGLASFTDSFRGNATRSIQLRESELDSLKNFIVENGFFQLDSVYIDQQVADAFIYTIHFTNNGSEKAVTTDGFASPENLNRIIAHVNSLRDQITNNGLVFTLTLSNEQITVGESLELNLTVTNTSGSPITLHFSNGQVFDFSAFTAMPGDPLARVRNTPVWEWSSDKVFTEAIWEMVLSPGETKEYQVTWDGKNADDIQLVGEYRIQAKLVSVPGGSSAEKRLLISE